MTVEVTVLCGVPGAGKSTWTAAHATSLHSVVSKDRMRNVSRRQERQIELLRAALHAGRSVIVDNTNLTRVDRAPLIEAARAAEARVTAVWVDAPLAVCMTRNAARSGRARVPDWLLRGMAARFEPPDASEGFDDVLHVVTVG